MKAVPMILAAGACILLCGCQTAKYGTYGPDAAWTTADSKVVDRAVYRTSRQLAHWIDNPDGTRSCPSMHAAYRKQAVGEAPDADLRNLRQTGRPARGLA